MSLALSIMLHKLFFLGQALIEKDWLAFGHPFSDRMGLPIVSGSSNMPFELTRQASTGSFPSSPMRQSSGTFTSQSPTSHAQTSSTYSPIFLQVCFFNTSRYQSINPVDYYNSTCLFFLLFTSV